MKKIQGFISDTDKFEILSFVNSLDFHLNINNEHINAVASKLNGTSLMFDISKTELSSNLSNFQSSENVIDLELPQIFIDIQNRISESFNISKENVFLQILNQSEGGLIHPHYDSAIDGYITYKCNVSVISENYKLFVDKEIIEVKEKDLYSFEASLYKHWTEPFKNKRVILSYGFILPYQELGRDVDDPRVRLSRRIQKYFQS